MSSVSSTQSSVAAGSVLLVGTVTGVAGAVGLGFATTAANVLKVNKAFVSGSIPLLGTYSDNAAQPVVTPCFSAEQLAKLILLPASTAAAAALPAITASVNGDPPNQLCKCGLTTVGDYKLILLA